MKRLTNEQGVTLMELLASITILAIFGIVVWGFFFQSLKFNDTETSKQELQQEAHLIISSIQQTHLKGDPYKVRTINDSALIIENQNGLEVSRFERKGIKYDITGSDFSLITGKVYPFKLKLSSEGNEKITYTIETKFSRIK